MKRKPSNMFILQNTQLKVILLVWTPKKNPLGNERVYLSFWSKTKAER